MRKDMLIEFFESFQAPLIFLFVWITVRYY